MIVTKKLGILLGLLAVMMGTLAVPAMAQQYQYGPQGEFIATGVLGGNTQEGPDPTPVYPITDEASGDPYELQSGFVDLESYVGSRVTVYGTPAPGIGTPPRYDVIRIEPADDAPPPVEEVSATGTIQPLADNPDAEHGITDEATGTLYALVSSSVDLDAYADGGRRVAVYGTLVETLAATEHPVLEVSRVEVLDDTEQPPPPPPWTIATFTYELAVECEPPANAEFLGLFATESLVTVPLTDPDGDGVYSGSQKTPKFAPGGSQEEPITISPVQIVQGPPTGSGPLGPEYRVIKDFGSVVAEDTTLSASVSFCDGGSEDGDGSGGNGDTNGDGGGVTSDNGAVGGIKTLPATGGALPMAGLAGLLIVAGGLVVRGFSR